jgi:hypothetical protein
MPNALDVNPISADRAWRLFSDWKENHKEIGLLFVSKSGTFSTAGTLRSARNGTVVMRGDGGCGAILHLKDAQFTYGPVMTHPNWPNPPMVEIVALQAYTANGTWIVMSEGLRPQSLSSPTLGSDPGRGGTL